MKERRETEGDVGGREILQRIDRVTAGEEGEIHSEKCEGRKLMKEEGHKEKLEKK